jgi:hypothetical protein
VKCAKGTLGFSSEKHVSSEIYIHPSIKTVIIRTDHTMAKGKRTKGQVMIYKTLHRKLKIEQHEPQIMWEKQKHTNITRTYTSIFPVCSKSALSDSCLTLNVKYIMARTSYIR